MTSPLYDLFVIGTGLAGQDVALACAEAGWSVGIADERPFGGTCPLRGCDPKKVLVHAAHAADQVRRLAGGHGLSGDPRIDWGELMAFKRTFTAPIPGGVEEKLDEAGVDYYHSAARFTGERTLAVGGETVEAEHVLIATGATPMELGIEGEEHLTRSDEFLEMDALPERLVFIGGGYISMEFAHLAARAGAGAVTMLEMTERVLQGFEPDVVEAVVAATGALGVQIETERRVRAVEKDGDTLTVVAEREENGDRERYPADAVVHGAGRVPHLDALDLEAAGVERNDDGTLALSEHLRSTSNPAVYAAGDAAQQGPPLTPVAHLDGRAVEKALLADGEPPNYAGTPSVVFTTPRLASVGLTEAEARDSGFDVAVESGDASGFFHPRHRRQEHAFYKVLAEAGSGRVLGAHLAYPHAEEVINVFALAVREGLRVNDLKAGVYTYPSAASDVQYMLP